MQEVALGSKMLLTMRTCTLTNSTDINKLDLFMSKMPWWGLVHFHHSPTRRLPPGARLTSFAVTADTCAASRSLQLFIQ